MSTLFWASYGVLWMLIALLGVALFILYSHVGERLLASREGNALQGPALGKRLEPRVFPELTGGHITLGVPSGVPRLVLFTSVECKPCLELVRILPEFVRRSEGQVEIIILSRGSADEIARQTVRLPSSVRIGVDPHGAYATANQIYVTPYAVALDSEGIPRFKTIAALTPDGLARFIARLTPTRTAPELQGHTQEQAVAAG